MTTAEQSDVMFELKEYEDGTPWLLINFDKPGLSCVKGNDLVSLRFRDSVSFEEAKKFRTLLHKMIKGMSVTHLG